MQRSPCRSGMEIMRMQKLYLKRPMRITRQFFFFLLLLFSGSLFSQVYTTDNNGSGKMLLTRESLFRPVYSFDLSKTASAKSRISYYRNYFSSAPVNIKECIYVNPASSFSLDSIFLRNELKPSAVPSSFRFYSDTFTATEKDDPRSDFYCHLQLTKSQEELYEPFYFKKTEVTNGEYREFVYWVLDSIARQALADKGVGRFLMHPKKGGETFLNKKEKIDWDWDKDTRAKLEFLYLPENERYYRRREIDFRRINYKYTESNKTVITINVFPDTMVWIDQFPFLWSEPLTNMYFWHPAFRNYPVVGITQLQAKAFLAWKTEQEQKELDEKGSDYLISYELPDEIEWEMMATATQGKNGPEVFSEDLMRLSDRSYFSDLITKPDTAGIIRKGRPGKTSPEQGSVVYSPESYRSIVIPTLASDELKKKPLSPPAQLEKDIPSTLYSSEMRYKEKWNKKGPKYPDALMKRLKDETGTCFMGGSVSEWMKETYKDNWLPVYTYHQNKLKKLNTADADLLLAVEEHYNSTSAVDGVLVRGGNWYDYDETITGGKDFEGMNKKAFVDPQKTYATVGFRYVVKISRKDEKTLLNADKQK
ncbi:MAG: SUMF1/EgtB/PvdO family nonheme iron enzyme [Bacteroidia bacterium]